jgi:hypothetical protein
MEQEWGEEFSESDLFDIGVPEHKQAPKSGTAETRTAKQLRPDSFANFVPPDSKESLIAHLEELAAHARQLYVLNPSANQTNADGRQNQGVLRERCDSASYILELIFADGDKTLPATLVADDYEAARLGKLMARQWELEHGKTADANADEESEGHGSEGNAVWRRRLARSVVWSISEIESRFAGGGVESLQDDLSAAHRAILLGASLAEGFATTEERRKYLEEAGKRRRRGNATGGRKRWETRAPYHAKVKELARVHWKKHSDADADDVARAITDKLHQWIDTQGEIFDAPAVRHLAQYIASLSREITSQED